MAPNQPVTSAVYGGKRGGKKPKPPAKKRPGTLVGDILGEEAVHSIYQRLGFRPPRRKSSRARVTKDSSK